MAATPVPGSPGVYALLVDARSTKTRRYAYATLACALTAGIAQPLAAWFDRANIVMLFLLAVVLVAVRYGRGPAVLAAFVSVALFDFFFVPPHYSFAVSDAQYLLTFAVMLAVGLITGQLTAGLRAAAEESARREALSQALYELARDLAGALTLEQVRESAQRFATDMLHARIALVLPADGGGMPPRSDDAWVDATMARVAFEGGGVTDTDAMPAVLYLPLAAPRRVRGVMAASASDGTAAALAAQEPLLQAVASLLGIAVERLHYVDVAHRVEVQMASERLRSSILSALSHDVRTPLTALVGLADALALGKSPLAPAQREIASAIREQSLRINEMVSKLLDMARLSAGKVEVKREWQPLQEVVGAALALLHAALACRPVQVDLAPDLPLVEFDAVLVERVLCNLIENADKYSAPGLPVEVQAVSRGTSVEVSVCDRGPGLPADPERLFAQFERGERESAKPGVGLGLAISRTIVEAHGGRLTASNREGGGACFTFTLPVGTPPAIEAETADEAG
jgi:two-component system sensor histidine kinase KdpD